MGFVTTIAQTLGWLVEHPIATALLCVAAVVFGLFGMPHVLSELEEPDSFLSKLGLIVVGFVVFLCAAYFGTLAWGLIAVQS